tara:strand:- start:37 stop:438 length:402 start_codon:yes stop_codon:yes gene_type:complete
MWFHPMALFAKLLLRNANATTFIASAQAYGMPRIYRRILTACRTMLRDEPSRELFVRDAVKSAIRSPTEALTLLSDSRVASFAVKYAESLHRNTSASVPPFMVSIASLLFKKTKFGKGIDILRKLAKPSKPAR